MSDFVNGMKKLIINMMDEMKLCDIQYGTVVSEIPLKIRLNQKLIPTEPQLMLTAAVKDRTADVLINGTAGRLEYQNHLKNGEKVFMIRNQGGQSFIVLGRLEN